jgi:hypothetical protein
MDLVDEDDEFFGAQDDEDVEDLEDGFMTDAILSSTRRNEFGVMAQRETLAKKDELKKVAFLDAYDEYKESKLQQGFEAGVLETFDVSTRIGKILGKVTTLQKLQQRSRSLEFTNACRSESSTGTVREFFSGAFQNESSEDSCTQRLQGLEKKLEIMMKHNHT